MLIEIDSLNISMDPVILRQGQGDGSAGESTFASSPKPQFDHWNPRKKADGGMYL